MIEFRLFVVPQACSWEALITGFRFFLLKGMQSILGSQIFS